MNDGADTKSEPNRSASSAHDTIRIGWEPVAGNVAVGRYVTRVTGVALLTVAEVATSAVSVALAAITGTPAGVGPLRDGDDVEVTIEGIGILANTVAG